MTTNRMSTARYDHLRSQGYDAGHAAAYDRMTDDIDDSRECRVLAREDQDPVLPSNLVLDVERFVWRSGYQAGWEAACLERASMLGGWMTPPASSPAIARAVQRSLARNRQEIARQDEVAGQAVRS